jgi:hypothetical protein
MGKTKDLSAFERGMVVGARRTGLCQELQSWWVFMFNSFLRVSRTIHHKLWKALESTQASIPVERFRNLVENKLRLFWEHGGATQY